MAKIELTSEELGLINRALSDSMNYEPNDRWSEKWSLLLALKQKQLELEDEQNQNNIAIEIRPERCPWYETVSRIVLVLGVVAALFCVFLCMLSFLLKCLNETLGCWDWVYSTAQDNPILAIICLIGTFVVFLLWFMSNLGKEIRRQWDE